MSVEPREITCPDCNETRMVRQVTSKPRRCYRCSRIRQWDAMGVVRERTCEVCETVFPVNHGQRNRKSCSPKCAIELASRKKRQKMLAQDRTAARNPNFRHGNRIGEHLRGWGISFKGEDSCRVCGGLASDLHHAVPRSICPPEAKRDLRNGIPLCKSCHARWHRSSVPPWGREVFTQDEWEYVSTLKLTGRDITGWLDKHYPEPLERAA